MRDNKKLFVSSNSFHAYFLFDIGLLFGVDMRKIALLSIAKICVPPHHSIHEILTVGAEKPFYLDYTMEDNELDYVQKLS